MSKKKLFFECSIYKYLSITIQGIGIAFQEFLLEFSYLQKGDLAKVGLGAGLLGHLPCPAGS